MKSNKNKGLGIYLAVLLALMLTLTAVFSQDTTPNLVKYSTILGYFEDQKVRDFELDYGTGDLSLVIEEDGKRRTVVSSVPNSLYFMDQIQDDIDKYNEANPGDGVLKIKALEAFTAAANGKATKIIIPSELQNLGGVVPSIKELLTDPKDAE